MSSLEIASTFGDPFRVRESPDDHVRARGFGENRDRFRDFLVNRAWTCLETANEGDGPPNAATKDGCGRGRGMLQEDDSGKKDSCASQKAGDRNGFLGDRDRNLGSGFGVRERGDRGGISMEGEDFLRMSVGKIGREGARTVRVERDGSRNRDF